MIGLSTKLFLYWKSNRGTSATALCLPLFTFCLKKKPNKKQNKTNKQMQKQTPNIQKTNKQRNNNQKQNITK